MDNQAQRIVSSFLFAGALTALGCSAEPDLQDAEDQLDEIEGPDRLVSDEDEARSGGGGCGGNQCCNDHDPPAITCESIELWPPNHQYVTIDLEDCITDIDECDPHWWAKILWVSSDEPENGQGDGNTNDDIVCVDDDTVRLRAERQGPGDGRVYEIRFAAEDHRHNKEEFSCYVLVPHDQGPGGANDSGEAYRVVC